MPQHPGRSGRSTGSVISSLASCSRLQMMKATFSGEIVLHCRAPTGSASPGRSRIVVSSVQAAPAFGCWSCGVAKSLRKLNPAPIRWISGGSEASFDADSTPGQWTVTPANRPTLPTHEPRRDGGADAFWSIDCGCRLRSKHMIARNALNSLFERQDWRKHGSEPSE